jgi:hypothetical protein
MPTNFSLATNLTRSAIDANSGAGVNANGRYLLWASAQQNNSNDLTSIRAHVQMSAIVPDFGDAPRNYEVETAIEGKYDNAWVRIARSFVPFRDTRRAREHVIVMQPNLVVVDVGVPDIDADLDGNEFSAKSSQAGKMPRDWRVAMYLVERGYGTPGAFQSITFSVVGEIYNV